MTFAILIIIGSGMGILGIVLFLAYMAGGGGKAIAYATLAMLTVCLIGWPLVIAQNAIAHNAYCHSSEFVAQYSPACKGN